MLSDICLLNMKGGGHVSCMCKEDEILCYGKYMITGEKNSEE